MKQTERQSKTAKQQIVVIKERLRYFKQKVAEAGQEHEIAYEKSKEANTRMELAKENEMNSSTHSIKKGGNEKAIDKNEFEDYSNGCLETMVSSRSGPVEIISIGTSQISSSLFR